MFDEGGQEAGIGSSTDILITGSTDSSPYQQSNLTHLPTGRLGQAPRTFTDRAGMEVSANLVVYDSLTANVPHCITSFHDFMFPEETTLYPPASVFQRYLLDFTEHFGLRKFIRLQTRVEEGIWNGTEWAVRISGEAEIQKCDHIILANGHYNKPYLPDYPGLKA